MFWAIFIAGLSQCWSIAHSELVPLEAKVIWVRGDRIYLATTAPTQIEWGATLRFRDHDKEVAVADITGLVDSTLITARIRSGSLAGVKKLEKLKIAVEPPPRTARTTLRVGYPSPKRVHLLFDCGEMNPVAGAYRAETIDERSFRFVADSTRVHGETTSLVPDTLLVRLFDDSTDEEIALERGEIEVGVFWPGEATAHIREVMHWAQLSGIKTEISLSVAADASSVPTIRFGRVRLAPLDSMNQELFRGDLLGPAIRRLTPSGDAPWDSLERVPPSALRFHVDRSCPGHETIERLLNHASRPGQDSSMDITLRCLREEYPAGLMFRLACPVIYRPGLLLHVPSDVLVNLFQCGPAASRP